MVLIVVGLGCGGQPAREPQSPRPESLPRAGSAANQALVLQGGVVDESYQYGPGGDLVEVRDNTQTSALTLAGVTPAAGPVGTIVTVHGSGFRSVASMNAVTLNGTVLAVEAASTQTLSFRVPTGASSGRIGVTVAGATVLSATDFNVTAPVEVTDFTPRIGKAGTAITIIGTNFVPDPTKDRVWVGAGEAPVSTATTTSIAATVGSGCSSGKVIVQAGANTGTSSLDFFMVPGTYTAANVESTGRLTPGQAQSISIAASGRLELRLLDAEQGQSFSIYVASNSIPSGTALELYDRTGRLVWNTQVGPTETKATVPPLPTGGTYTLLIRSPTNQVGTMSLTLFPDVTAELSASAGPISLTIAKGQNGTAYFSATPGDFPGLGITALATTPAGAVVWLVVSDSVGVQLGTLNPSAPTSWQIPEVGMAGRHALGIQPVGPVAASVSLLLSRPLSAKVIPDGPAWRFTTGRPGQSGRVSFDGQAGTAVTLVTTSSAAFTPTPSIRLVRSDGTTQAAANSSATGAKLDSGLLSSSATYTVAVLPAALGVGSVDVQVLREVTGSVTTDGPQGSIVIGAGRNGRYTFDGNAGDLISIGIPALATTPANGLIGFATYKPDGSLLLGANFGSPQTWQLPVLPTSGTYTLTMRPPGVGAASGTLSISRPLAGVLAVDGAQTTFQTSRPGQIGRYTFQATAGQSLTLAGTSVSGLTAGATIAVLRPDGSTLGSANLAAGATTKIDLSALAAAGTYTVQTTPITGSTGSARLLVQNQPTDTLVPGGGTKQLTLGFGQNGRYAFSGTATKLVDLTLSSIATVPASSVVYLYAYKPDGAMLWNTTANSGPKTWRLPTLPTTGTYILAVKPNGTASASFGLSLVSN